MRGGFARDFGDACCRGRARSGGVGRGGGSAAGAEDACEPTAPGCRAVRVRKARSSRRRAVRSRMREMPANRRRRVAGRCGCGRLVQVGGGRFGRGCGRCLRTDGAGLPGGAGAEGSFKSAAGGSVADAGDACEPTAPGCRAVRVRKARSSRRRAVRSRMREMPANQRLRVAGRCGCGRLVQGRAVRSRVRKMPVDRRHRVAGWCGCGRFVQVGGGRFGRGCGRFVQVGGGRFGRGCGKRYLAGRGRARSVGERIVGQPGVRSEHPPGQGRTAGACRASSRATSTAVSMVRAARGDSASRPRGQCR